MKKNIILSMIAASAVLTACDQDLLEIPQKGVVTTDTFYQTDEDAEAALVAAYQGFLWNVCTKEGPGIYAPFRACFNLCSDDMYAAGEQFGDNDFMGAMNEFRYDNGSEVIRNTYNNLYYAIYYSNLVIDNFPNPQTAVQKRAVAEARVLRAYMHMMLAIGWNCPPLADHVLGAAELPANYGNNDEASHKELLRWCAKECEDVLADLDERTSPDDKKGAVKVTKGFANAVAGKAYLFAGDYENSKAALKRVIDSGKYQLVPGDRFWQNFHIEGDANEEKVFEANLEVNANIPVFWDIVNRSTWMESQIWNWRSDHFVANPTTSYSSIDGWGGCGVPQEFADEMIANDGADSYRLKATMIPITEVVYDTKYGIDEIDNMTREEKQASNKVGINLKGLYGQSFYLPLKPVCRTADLVNPGTNVRVNNFVIMRYAEVLLMYAEDCLQTGDAATAKTYINMIQQRAGSKTISDEVDMNVLKREKRLELWLEGCRWADLVRWGDIDGVKKAGQNVTVLYDKLSRPVSSTDENVKFNPADDRFYTVTTHAAKDRGDKIGFVQGKHEFFPFPNTVTSKNPNLIQNQGWE